MRFESYRQVPQPTVGWRTWLRKMTLLFNLEATSWRQYVSMKEYSLVRFNERVLISTGDVFGSSKWKCNQFWREGMKFAYILQDLTKRWNAKIFLPIIPDGLRFSSLQSRWIWYFCHNSFRQHKMWQKRRIVGILLTKTPNWVRVGGGSGKWLMKYFK